ncbi:MAG: acyl-ACP desaturase [Candidatus Nanopelagicales bacterium]|jgi:acyl-[acyl-carrier-protein] desaturase|nr:acyl-ACP desaturase [Candidatus Nanopelagicales bacterium]
MTTEALDADLRLLIELEPVAEAELSRHMSMAKEWFPHDYIPWSEGKDFAHLGGTDWTPDEQRYSEAARTSLIINLLTEDNLPSYHHEIATIFGRDGAWGTWVGRWTAEENRHGIAIRDYLVVTRAVDPVALERARMQHMVAGFSATHPGLLAGLSYVSFQELATRVSHRNTGTATGDPLAEALLSRIATDENLHMVFYRNVLNAAFEVSPDATMQAVTNSVRDFAMPGHGIDGFTRKAVEIAVAGIYDIGQHRNDVVMPVLRYWKVFERNNFGPDGEIARQELADMLDVMDVQAKRFDDKREALRERLRARD